MSNELLLFNKWSFSDIYMSDQGLIPYISIKPVIIPHSSGRYTKQQFKKRYKNIVERFLNKLMSPGRNSGKKMKVIRALEGSFDIIYYRTNINPIQVLVSAIENCAILEDVVRIELRKGGNVVYKIVDVSSSRRVDFSLRSLANSIKKQSANNGGGSQSLLSFEEIIAKELIGSSQKNINAGAYKVVLEKKRIVKATN